MIWVGLFLLCEVVGYGFMAAKIIKLERRGE